MIPLQKYTTFSRVLYRMALLKNVSRKCALNRLMNNGRMHSSWLRVLPESNMEGTTNQETFNKAYIHISNFMHIDKMRNCKCDLIQAHMCVHGKNTSQEFRTNMLDAVNKLA